LVATRELRGKLYYLELEIIPEIESCCPSYEIWHRCLAHPSKKKMKEILAIHEDIKVDKFKKRM
jgi:hypothetical protein